MNYYKILALLLISTSYTWSQTSNVGQLYVNPDTQLSIVNNFENKNSAVFINDGEILLYADLFNEGMLDYNNGGLTHFRGANQQNIGGTATSYLFNMLVDNVSELENALSLSSTLRVANHLDLTEGIVNTIDNDGQFILETLATVDNTSDLSFVDGFMTKVGSSLFRFPIGDDEYYRYAAISAPSNVGAAYKARYVYQDSENLYPASARIGNITTINENEYWIIENETSAVEAIDVTLSWDEFTTTPNAIVSNPEEAIRMARWDFQQEAWVEVQATVNVFDRTITASQSIQGMGVYTIARANLDIILPDDVVIWNAVSPDGDGKNDYLLIENLHLLPNNEVHIFNRWGAEVFTTNNYGTTGNVFEGYAKGKDKLLPSGTYFYVITYDSNSSGRVKTSGYLYLSTD